MNQWLVVGLGNPGTKYEKTRHNVGFMVLDYLATECGLEFKKEQKFNAELAGSSTKDLILAKPLTYMNSSGLAVSKICSFYKLKPEQVVVIYDDLDLPFGHLRVKAKSGSGGHNGIKSLVKELPSGQDFYKIRIGIGRPSNPRMAVEDWVLSRLTADESAELEKLFSRVKQAIEELTLNGLKEAQNKFN